MEIHQPLLNRQKLSQKALDRYLKSALQSQASIFIDIFGFEEYGLILRWLINNTH
jgi:hypothetical protein